MRYIFLICCMFIFMMSCKTSLNAQGEKDALKLADDYFEDQEYVLYTNGDYLLIHTQVTEDPLKPDYLLKYLILDKSNNEVIKKGSLNGGYIKWIDDQKVEMYSAPGIPQGDKTRDDYTIIYDVATKKETLKSQYQKD